MPEHTLRRQVIDLCHKVGKPLLKLSTKDYVENGLGHLVKEFDGQAGLVNIEVFNELQHTITGWPGGKPDVDDSTRPERAKPYPKRVVVFSPHPDDDVISMGGTIRRLMHTRYAFRGPDINTTVTDFVNKAQEKTATVVATVVETQAE